MLEHGGGVRQAASRFAIPLDDWLDLSTGINPHARLPESLPAACWARLPEEQDGLEEAARRYYGTDLLLPVAGSQAVIQLLPRLRVRGRVAVLHPTYAEHAHAWQQAGHQVQRVAARNLEPALEAFDVVVVVNPNNPTGARFDLPRLLSWHERLLRKGGWLVVDEAFMDTTPAGSLSPHVGMPGLVVLRSLGKFFGLAGVRAGFLLAWPDLLSAAREVLGPWTVAGPSRFAARLALEDRSWQEQTRRQLPQASRRLALMLLDHGLPPSGATALFQWVPGHGARDWWVRLARHGILTRCFDDPPGLRFGLPGAESSWLRLRAVLTTAFDAQPG